MKRLIFFIVPIVALSSPTFAGDTAIIANVEKKIPLSARSTVIPPVVRETYEYYEVCGCCEADLKGQLRQKCITGMDGRKYDAETNWKVKWDYGHNREGQTCSVDSFTVTVDIRYRLPKWTKPSDAPRDLAEKWETYSKNLLVHEGGHRDRAVAAAADLAGVVADLPPYRTCSELDQEVSILSRARMKKLEMEQRQYDTVTSHGAAQGALFP